MIPIKNEILNYPFKIGDTLSHKTTLTCTNIKIVAMIPCRFLGPGCNGQDKCIWNKEIMEFDNGESWCCGHTWDTISWYAIKNGR